MALFNTTVLANTVEEEARKQGVDPKVARAILLSENSGYGQDGKLSTKQQIDSDTTSPAGAMGIMQVMPKTFQGLVNNGLLSPTDNPTDPLTQIRAGIAAIKDGQRVTKTPTEQAAYYNGGNAALTALRNGQPLNPETQGYVKKFGEHMGLDTSTDPSTPPTQLPPPSQVTRESYSKHTSSKDIPPDIMANILRSTEAYNGLSAGTLSQLQALTSTILPNADQQNAAVDQQSKAKVEQIKAQQGLDNATLQSKGDIASAFGVNIAEPDNIVARNKLVANTVHNERAQLQDQITALSSKSPMSDPVGWLMDSLKAAPLINRHNALLDQENTAEHQIQVAQQETAQQQAIQPANIKDALNSKAMADVNMALADATAKKVEITGVARAKMAQSLGMTLSVMGQDVSNNLRIGELFSKSIGMSENFTTKEDAGKYGLLNATVGQYGIEPFTPEAFKAMAPDIQHRLMASTQFGRLGNSPGDAVSLLYNIGGGQAGTRIKNAPQANQFVQQVVAEGQKTADDLVAKPMIDPAVKAAMGRMKGDPTSVLSFGVDQWVKAQEQELTRGNMLNIGPKNPYRLDAANIALDSRLANNPIAQEIIKNPTQKPDEQWVLATVGAKLASGEITSGDAAAMVTDFYNTGLRAQAANRAMPALGFKAMPTYPVNTKLHTFTSQSVDLLNPASVENFLVAQTAALKSSPFRGTSMNVRIPQ